jgi:small GTP-binding protein
MTLQMAETSSNLLDTLFTACLNGKIKHDKIKGIVYYLVGKELDDKVKELFGSLLVDWDDELYNKLRIHSLSLPKLANIKFEGDIVFVGGSGVGKTCIFNRLTSTHPEIEIPDVDLTLEESIQEQTLALYKVCPDATVGANFRLLASKEFNFRIWDTSGQERYINISRTYATQADFIIVVSDAEHYDENKIKYWIQMAEECRKHWIHVLNKCDTVPDIDHYKETLNYKPHFCVSARTGQGLGELRDFIILAEFFADHQRRLEFVNETISQSGTPSRFCHCIIL